MNTYTPIACHIHDYIEIACLYHFEIELTLRDGDTVAGRARTTRVGADHHEYLVLIQQGFEREVDLAEISSMRAISDNPHFDSVDFTDSDAPTCVRPAP